MCAINGCDEPGTITVGEGDDAFQLCAKHADKTEFPRTGCRICGKAVRIAGTPVRDNRSYGPPNDFRLCTTCDALPKARCAGCDKIVRIGDNPIGASQRYGEPDNLRLCTACDQTTAECAHCSRIVRANDRRIVDNRSFGAPDNLRLCAPCNDLAKIECDGCRRILKVDQTVIVGPIRYYRNRQIRLCVACDGAVTPACACRACGAPAAYDAPAGRRTLRGASAITRVDSTDVVGWRCVACGTGSLNSRDEAQPHYDAVVQWMTGWVQANGEAYPDYGPRLQWDVARDATFTTEAGGQTLGACETTTQGDAPKTYRLQVLNFIRPIAFQRTLTHELTHALTNDLGIAEREKIEGFCNYVAYCFMRHLTLTAPSAADRDEAAEHIERLNSNPNQAYGVDFRTIRDALQDNGDGAIAWLRAAQ